MAAYVSSSFVKALYLADRAYGSERFPFGLPRWVNRVDYWLSPLRVERRVFGFADCTRYRVWFRDQLAEFLRDTLLSTGSLTRPYWNAEDLKRIVSDHISGHGNFLHTLRKVLQVEMMHRVLLERQWSADVVASPRAACDECGQHQPANAVLSHQS